MNNLSQQRCLNHEVREAVARCPECREYFCRECVSEHDGRVICAACLRNLLRPVAAGSFRFTTLLVAGELAAGLLTVWLFFYAVGRNLIAIPDSFHEGTVWKSGFFDEP
jgi:hypothetical protein